MDKRQEVVTGEPGALLHPAIAGDPLPDPDGAISEVMKARNDIGVLDHPPAADSDPADRNRLSGQVEILSSNDIHSVVTDKQAECGAKPGIDIEQFVRTVTAIETESNVENAFVICPLHELVRLFTNDRIRKTNTERRHSRVYRCLMNLSPRQAEETN